MAHAQCGLRCDISGVWSAIDDAHHKPKGIKAVKQTSTQVEVYLTDPLPYVTAPSADPDETYIRYGIECGASVAEDVVVIKFTRDTDPIPRPYLDPKTLYIPYANVWLEVEEV